MDLTQVVLYALAAVGFAWLTITVHEYGHLAVGRAAGVPAGDIRVRYTPSPPHVALRSGEQWLAPDDPGYADTFQEHRAGVRAAWVFVAGGFLLESVLAVGGAAALTPVAPATAAVWLGTSTVIFLAYVVVDLLGRARAGAPTGDTSAMLAIHGPATIVPLLVMVLGRGLALAWVGSTVW